MRVVVAGTAGLLTARTFAGFHDHGGEIVRSPCRRMPLFGVL
ncbi:hypothetical protein QFZ76_009665 [Streptomyces sp. V4I2]|nr:hypothetical protein [Streptomyces sp. V4I2]